jgi:biotin-dependent carboxylase-like uncharacterized protein
VIEIVDEGMLTTVQDAGRPGYAAVGVSPSGAVDRELARHCNRLVGNPDGAAVLETVGGLVLCAVSPVVVASDVESVARVLAPGDTLHVDVGGRQWHYVAVRGGVDVEPVLGSRATDTLSGLGPRCVAAGQQLPIGDEPSTAPVGETWPVRPPPDVIRLTRGPRADWFTSEALATLAGVWTVSDASRVGIRLAGPALERAIDRELSSEGLIRGAIQVPPDGAPIMVLADHPTTGGYPVIAVVHPADVAALAQHLVGSTVTLRFVPSSGGEAHQD